MRAYEYVCAYVVWRAICVKTNLITLERRRSDEFVEATNFSERRTFRATNFQSDEFSERRIRSDDFLERRIFRATIFQSDEFSERRYFGATIFLGEGFTVWRILTLYELYYPW